MAVTIMERIDSHTHVPSEKLVPSPSFPEGMKIEITSRCNYSCSYCASKRHLRPQGEIDRDFLQRILREAKGAGVREVGMFLLGESLLVPRLPEYVAYAKNTVGIEYVFLTTNGSLATPRIMGALLKAGIDSVKFSVNAGSRGRYREMHGVDAFDGVLENIKWLHGARAKAGSAKPRISVSSIHDPAHLEELEAFKGYIQQYIDDFYYLPLYNQGGHVGGVDFTKIVGNPGRWGNMVAPVPCWALFNAARVTWDGHLTACSFDHDNRFVMGDLNRQSLIEAWNAPNFMDLRTRHLEGGRAALKESPCAECLGL